MQGQVTRCSPQPTSEVRRSRALMMTEMKRRWWRGGARADFSTFSNAQLHLDSTPPKCERTCSQIDGDSEWPSSPSIKR